MKNWNRADANACVHAIIEPGGDVYQLLPWEHRGWHCGGDGNNTHIGVEMTELATIRYAGGANWTETGDGENTKGHVLAAYKYAVELFAYLCQQFRLDPLADGVIICHSEGCRRGIASNHGDGILSEKEKSVRGAVCFGYAPALSFGRLGGGREGRYRLCTVLSGNGKLHFSS